MASEMINDRAQRTNGFHCPLAGTELNLRQSKGLNMIMGLTCQLLNIEPIHSIRKSRKSSLRVLNNIFCFNFHECYTDACSVNYIVNWVTAHVPTDEVTGYFFFSYNLKYFYIRELVPVK